MGFESGKQKVWKQKARQNNPESAQADQEKMHRMIRDACIVMIIFNPQMRVGLRVTYVKCGLIILVPMLKVMMTKLR